MHLTIDEALYRHICEIVAKGKKEKNQDTSSRGKYIETVFRDAGVFPKAKAKPRVEAKVIA